MRHFLSIANLERREILEILDRSDELRTAGGVAEARLRGAVVGLFFFQGSTRTRTGFHAAALRLGAAALSLDAMRQNGGMSAAEDPVDAFRSVASYCDLVVLRHADEEGFERMIADAPVPVINGGYGTRHHPTQALIDLAHVRTRLGHLDGLRWGIVGDLARSRAARSLVDGLGRFEIAELRLISPPERTLPPQEMARVPAERIRRLDRLDLSGLDVLYMAGYPEGCGAEWSPRAERWRFRLTVERARQLSGQALILDPLPRIDEIERGVDELPQAAYFDQSRGGLYVRMAVLEQAIGGPPDAGTVRPSADVFTELAQ